MLFLGVLSVFQLIIFPGLLLIRLFSGTRSHIQQAAYIFMLSLLANYTVIFVLTGVGLYTRLVVMALFLVEAALLVWQYQGQLLALTGGWNKRFQAAVSEGVSELSRWLKKDFWSASLYILFGILAVAAIGWVLWVWVTNFTTVFQHWDVYASWDRWAETWARGRYPGDTWEYPQLIPVSFSLTYKFIGTTAVKFFAGSIMPLFTLFIGLMIFDLGRKYRSFGYMLGSAFAVYTIWRFLGGYIPDGYVDIPVACFSLMGIFTLLHAREAKDESALRSTLLLGSLSTAAAAVTKQTGLYVMAFYPIFAYLWVLHGREGYDLRKSAILLVRHFALTLLLVAPWYIYMEWRIQVGGNSSNIQYVISDIYKGATLPERFVAAVAMLRNYAYYIVFALVSLVVLKKEFRHLVILVVFPFAILWAFFLSYEVRNLAVALPLLAMAVGVSAEAWFERIRGWIGKPRELKAPLVALVLAAALLVGAGTLVWNEDTIIAHQISEQRKIFKPELNQKLYRFFSSQGGPEKVISNYPVGWLPGLEEQWVYERFDDYDIYHQTLESRPEVTLILLPEITPDPRISNEVQQNLISGLYERILSQNNYILVRIPAR